MENLNKILSEKLKALPTTPGVYKMKTADGVVLYVGKAKNLKNRVKSYFQKIDKPTRTQKLVEKIEDLERIEVNSELEAFLLESNLVKQLLPKYNILLKDGKNFTYLKINLQEKFPRIEIVRQLKKDGAKYFGPKLSAKGLSETVRMLQEIYPVIFNNIYLVNSYPKKLSSNKEAESLDGVSEEEYKEAIEKVLGFFQGKYEEIEKSLQGKMMDYAKEGKFEVATRLRDMLFEFKKTIETQIISEPKETYQDVFGFFVSEERVYVSLFQVRSGKIVGNENLTFDGIGEDKEILESLISQYYAHTDDIPKEILLPCDFSSSEQPPQTSLGTNTLILEDFFQENFQKKVKILVPQKGKKSKLIELAENNAKTFAKSFEDKESRDKEKIKKAFSEISEALGVKSSFTRIECFDISHFAGTDTVASMVVFTDGVPDKKYYKKFDVKSLAEGEIDDFKSMFEILDRRLRNLENSLLKTRQVPQFIYEKLTKKKLAEIEISEFTLFPNLEEGNFVTYKASKNTKLVGVLVLQKFDNKTFELNLEKSTFHGEKEELLKDFLIKAPEILAEKNLWLHQEKESDLLLENGFKKLKTLDGNSLEKDRGLVSESLAQSSLNRFKEVGFFFQKAFGKKIWEDPVPNLIVVDGGKGQLSSAVEAFRANSWALGEKSTFKKKIGEKEIEVLLCSLAKKEEEIFVVGKSDPINLPNTCEGSFLFQRLRDEAHRFAITFQRNKRLKVFKI